MATKFGVGQLTAATPVWAKWTFGIVVLITTALTIWVSGTNILKDASKVEYMLGLKCLDFLFLGVSKMFGVQTESNETEKN